MSVAEILAGPPKLSTSDQTLIRLRVDELMEDFSETPETLAAIDAGFHSAETGPSYSSSSVRAEISQWITRSS